MFRSVFDRRGEMLPFILFWTTVSTLAVAALFALIRNLRRPKYPVVNHDLWSFTYKKARKSWLANAKTLLEHGYKITTGPFYVVTENGEELILRPSQAEFVHQDPRMDLTAFLGMNFLAHIDEFRLLRAQVVDPAVAAIRKGLTRNLTKFIIPMSQEMSSILEETWGRSQVWQPRVMRQDVLQQIARLSSLAFVGPELAHNEEWIDIAIQFTLEYFSSLFKVKLWPSALRPLVTKFLPDCQQLNIKYKKARTLLEPIIVQRQKERLEASREGRKAPVYNDAIEWLEGGAKGNIRVHADHQLFLTTAAVHTTSDLVLQAFYNLCEYPEVVEPLRQEVIDVLGRHGWEKTAVYEMKLLDSFLKETQRMKPIIHVTMHRIALADVVLPDGTIIRKGESTAVPLKNHWDPACYTDPTKFDPFRFARMRADPNLAYKSHMVSTSPDFLAFGHGTHACPGRYFAANEVKIIMAHSLLKYEFRFHGETRPKVGEFGNDVYADPLCKIEVRRRADAREV